VITGADNRDDAKAKAYNMGASGFISKPFDAADIRASAQAHINYRQTTEQLQQQTILDSLTGLLNKRGFNAQLEKDISFSARHRHQLTVLDIHVDAFKEMFVRIGRDGAEQIVKKVGEVIGESVRKEDTVARTGLAQFSVILPAANPDSSLLIAHRICQTVANFKARHKGKLLPISVSAGACIVEPGVHADCDSVVEIAFQARASAELRGLGQVESIELGAYRRAQQGQPSTALSIDDVLQEIAAGGGKDVQTHIDSVLRELKPIFALLTDEQRQQIANGEYSGQ
jgi:diguanylate cyclase (GGDEF)-like protein